MPTPVIQQVAGSPRDNELVYQPFGAVRDVFYCHEPEVLIEGPAGTGKSRGVLEKLHLLCRMYPDLRALMVRKTRESMTQSVMVTFAKKVVTPADQVRWHDTNQEYRYPNGSRIVVGGLDKSSRIMSTDYDLIYVNESTEIEEGEWEDLLTRLRNWKMPFQQAIADCNPSGPDHWLNKRFPPEGAPSEGKARFRSRHQDNPELYDHETGTWTPQGAAYIEKLDKLTGFRKSRLRHGAWVAAEGQFFEEWNPDLHVCLPFAIPRHWTKWVAVDYGYADPFCALWAARDPDTKQTYLYREVYETGWLDERQAQYIRQVSEGEYVSAYIGDPSMFNARPAANLPSIAQVYWRNGVPLQPGNNRRRDGWQVVRRFLASDMVNNQPPKLQIFSTCRNLIRTLPAMVKDPLDPEDVADKLDGKRTEDHAVDALRYLCMAEEYGASQRHDVRTYRLRRGRAA